jgi:serine/threonine-protein kinase
MTSHFHSTSPRVALRLLLAAALVLTSTALGRPAAAEVSAADKAAAEALFEQGRALIEQQRYEEACAKFEASQQLDEGLGTMLYLADCYEKAGKTASAWATFEEAASRARTEGQTQREDIAKVRAAALEPQLIRVVIEVPATPPEGFIVRRNGTAIPPAAFGAPVPVDPGVWLIRASAPDHQAFEVSLTLKATDLGPHIVTIPQLKPQPSAATPPPRSPVAQPPAEPQPTPVDTAPPDDTASSQKTLGLIVGSAGVIAVVVGGIFSVMANTANSNSKDNCRPDDPNACSVQGVNDREDAQSHATTATVANIIGVAAIAGGATLYFTAPQNDGQTTAGAMIKLKGTW